MKEVGRMPMMLVGQQDRLEKPWWICERESWEAEDRKEADLNVGHI